MLGSCQTSQPSIRLGHKMREASRIQLGSTICSNCTNIVPLVSTGHTSRLFHHTMADLRCQAPLCSLCSYLWSQFSDVSNQVLDTDIFQKVRLKEMHEWINGIRWALLEFTVVRHISGRKVSEIHQFSVTTCPDNSIRSQTAPWSTQMLKSDRISMLGQWLQNCESKHQSACEPIAGQMPTRLIQVGGVDDKAPRLVLTSQSLVHRPRYATLSHCWGARLPLRTLNSNIEEFSTRIPYSSIPKSFTDAIAITQSLSIPYLWIDALCIVQDDTEEWKRESMIMKDIYAGSTVNIAAADASDSDGGCLHDGSGVHFRTITVHDAYDNKWKIRLQEGDTRELILATVLNSRGWVLQEQLLSRRMVSCMSSEWHWECGCELASETGACFPQVVAPHTTPSHALLRLKLDASIVEQGDVWRSWIENYSKRRFTFWGDRLPALLGIMQLYGTSTGDEPIIGLWKRTLRDDLLWLRVGELYIPKAEVSPLASWSWMSCLAEIAFDFWQLTATTSQEDRFITTQLRSNMVESVIEWSALPYLSNLDIAYISLEAPLADLCLDLDEETADSNPPYLKVTNLLETVRGSGQFDSGPIRAGKYCCMLLASRRHEQTCTARHIFLILEAGKHSNEYRRIGLGCTFDKNPFCEHFYQKIVLI